VCRVGTCTGLGRRPGAALAARPVITPPTCACARTVGPSGRTFARARAARRTITGGPVDARALTHPFTATFTRTLAPRTIA
jgi:hypothetical protein